MTRPLKHGAGRRAKVMCKNQQYNARRCSLRIDPKNRRQGRADCLGGGKNCRRAGREEIPEIKPAGPASRDRLQRRVGRGYDLPYATDNTNVAALLAGVMQLKPEPTRDSETERWVLPSARGTLSRPRAGPPPHHDPTASLGLVKPL